jgi:RNA polymerase sigma-70 factor (ECF subfamily)
LSSEPIAADSLPDLDPQAISQFHDRLFPELYRYVRFRTGDPVVAEDLASEAFVRLLEAVRNGRGPRTTVRGWLLSTASHLIADHFRQRYSHPPQPLRDDLPQTDTDPILRLDREEEQGRVRAALLSLTAEQQHVLALRFQGGYSLAEVAELMGKRPNAIKALQFRALMALRKALARRPS